MSYYRIIWFCVFILSYYMVLSMLHIVIRFIGMKTLNTCSGRSMDVLLKSLESGDFCILAG